MGRIPLARIAASYRYVRIGGSGVHGRGLFAWRRIPEGAHVMEYLGNRVTKRRSEDITDRQWEEGRVYTFELNKRYDIDGAIWWNRTRFANHSCEPNCEAQSSGGGIWIVALRDIERGEEITYDYNFPASGELHKCRCGSKLCCGYIVGKASRGALASRLKTARRAKRASRKASKRTAKRAAA